MIKNLTIEDVRSRLAADHLLEAEILLLNELYHLDVVLE